MNQSDMKSPNLIIWGICVKMLKETTSATRTTPDLRQK